MFSNVTMGCPNGFHPYLDNHTNALTPCFLSLVNLVSVLFFSCVGVIQLIQLLRETKIPPNFKYKFRWSSLPSRHLLHITDISLQVVILVLQLCVLFSNSKSEQPLITQYAILSNIGFLVLISYPTQYLEYYKSPCTIGNQIFYFMFQICLVSFQIIQRFTHGNRDALVTVSGKYSSILECLLLFNTIVIFIYETRYFKPAPQVIDFYKSNDLFITNHALADIWFMWMNKLISQTYKDKKIKDPHNLPLPPIDLDIRTIATRMESSWEKQKWNGTNSILRVILTTFCKSLIIAMLYETTTDILTVIEPQFLRVFIKTFEMNETNVYPPLQGAIIVVALFLSKFISTLLGNQFYIKIFEVGLGIRGSLMALVYKKSLRISSDARQKHSSGDIINLMSTDVLNLQRFFENSQSIIGAPIQIVIVLISLYLLLDKAVFAGMISMVIMIPINAYLSRKVGSLYKTQMKYKDSRLTILTEILNSIKSIKLYSWEKPMLKKLLHVRNDLELENFKKIGIFSNLIFFAWNCVPLMVTCSTFLIFSMISDVPLSPDIIFPSLTLFNILNDAIYVVPSTINDVIQANISMKRLRDFLLAEELDDSFIEYKSPSETDDAPVIEINNATFLWQSKKIINENSSTDEESNIETSKAALKNIDNFTVKKGSLTCIVGKVGSGKSTILHAILGQLPCISALDQTRAPKVTIRATSIAYCPQEAWIMNSSVKENIVFGHKHDENYYNLVIQACQLASDLSILPDGDETIVGEKGISLVGGVQKARISLARAVYARADVYLLDDILSAVDAHVSKNIIKYVLSKETGLLRNKTIILSTNNVNVLKNSQKIYAIEKGEIVEESDYENVMNSSDASRIKKLIEEFGTSTSNSNEVKETSSENSSSEIEDKTSNATELLKKKDIDEDNDIVESIVSFDAENMFQNISMVNSRRASMATLKRKPVLDLDKSKKKTAQQEETKEEGRVKTRVYIAYIKACGVTGVILFFVFMILTRIFDLAETFWLKYWSESNAKAGYNKDFLKFVTIYAIIGLLSAAFNNIRTVIMLLYCSIRGSKKLHDGMALSVMRSPMSFFETTPIGRIVNRFSSDLEAIDSGLQYIFSFFFRSVLIYVVSLILVGYNLPWFIALNAVLIMIYFYYQAYYIMLSRELKRLTTISYSPIMSLISETLGGFSVINAFDHTSRFNFFNFETVQYNIDCVFQFRSTNRWLSVRLQTIGNLIILATGLLSFATLGTKKQLSSGMVGLLMSYSLQVTSSLMWIVRMTVQIETRIVSVERTLEYCELKPEALEIIENSRPPEGWPREGAIEFNNYTTKYRENLDPVLKDINVSIKPKEKIGIVGRTGAGKSTLTLALFRLIEATGGSISIDGIDISKIGLEDLRSNLAIIPQDAQAFEGTIRSNLDPFDQHSDEELWRAVELSHLKQHILRMNEEANDRESDSSRTDITTPDSHNIKELLATPISKNGSNVSVGQRQLLCLSRALLNPSKVLILDEATAAIDMETDKIVQDTIKNEFKERTILTIAHRIDTVMNYDKILVLDKGEVAEFDTVSNLLSDKNTMFYKLCEQGAYLKE
ncbi:hypothetical protein TPHA_0F00410 [Tetrapisispora phaffii CBS 4417]|uniref:Bile pigment transporter 1 n=1 Tax=Tetrapisispora phaffii (strain ATCC 24235 / CBS 4417 / NBRC 1672 / NRRL Y-8282 / UCD 70-5) TaxID=1071381 RepID=G8BUU6_TETPH|nr:hypothetical protein TPHA_0F00410 [Tetrapisispora phaffii CBS 4417]CCE63528.1 hypothetical protein TPHA_0F00410 [Tetrapisispora phaffii CBS 4417]